MGIVPKIVAVDCILEPDTLKLAISRAAVEVETLAPPPVSAHAHISTVLDSGAVYLHHRAYTPNEALVWNELKAIRHPQSRCC